MSPMPGVHFGAAVLFGCAFLSAQGPDELIRARHPHAAQGTSRQDPHLDAPSVTARSCRRPSAGVVEQESGLWGVGDAYKARFDGTSIEFIPALGDKAPHNYPLRLQTAGVGRDEVVAVGAAQVRHQDLRVEYARAEVREVYDVRPEGVEQSFVFDRLPAGKGDLHVRLAATTELQPAPWDQGLKFQLPEVGGVTIGAVTGVDANGQRCQGSVRFDGTAVDLVLPAAFVDRATLPLTVDPMIGSLLNVRVDAIDDTDPDVAFDATNARYLVTFVRHFSASDWDIHGQFVATDGTLIGGRLLIENSTAFEWQGVVADVNLRDHFVVVYSHWNSATSEYDIYARSVDASTGAFSPAVVLASGTDNTLNPDVSGEATLNDDDAIAVWENVTQNSIEAMQVTVNADGTLSPFGLTTIVQDASITPHTPRIDKSGGSTGNHLIVWRRDFSSTDRDPQGAIINRNIVILDSLVWLDSTVNYTSNPRVDGDGRQWVVAWEQREATGTLNDIVARGVSWVPSLAVGSQGAFLTSIVPIEFETSDNEFDPYVCCVGSTWLVGWTDDDSPSYSSYVDAINPFTCDVCEAAPYSPGREWWIDGSAAWDLNSRAASRLSGGDPVEEALIVLQSEDSTSFLSDIQGQIWASNDGVQTDLGFACGSGGGTIYASCARAGYSAFTVNTVAATPNANAWLVISHDTLNLTCGSCHFVPNPYTGFVIPVTTTAGGVGSFAIAIPADPGISGLSFTMQWAVETGLFGSCPVFGSDLSNAMRLTIQ